LQKKKKSHKVIPKTLQTVLKGFAELRAFYYQTRQPPDLQLKPDFPLLYTCVFIKVEFPHKYQVATASWCSSEQVKTYFPTTADTFPLRLPLPQAPNSFTHQVQAVLHWT